MRITGDKRTAGIMAVCVAAMLLGGCADKAVEAAATQTAAQEAETTQEADAAKEPISVEELYQMIQQEVTLASPVCMDDDFIMNYYGIDASILDEYVFSMSEDATQAETVIVMKVKDTADLDDLASCLQVVVDEKKNEMENYIPEQFEIVEKSEVRKKGNYIWLVISEHESAICDIIDHNIS